MYIADIVNDDVWGMVAMSRAMSEPVEGQLVPTDLETLFQPEPLDTIDVMIESEGQSLSLVPAAPYGGVGDQTTLNRATGEVFRLITLPTGFDVQASEVQGQRAFGTSELESIELRRDRKLAKARARLEATRQFHRAKALFAGQIYDANASDVLLNINSKFGITRQSLAIAVDTDTTKVKSLLEKAKDMSADAVGGASPIIGWRCYAGRNWFNGLVNHKDVLAAFDRFTGGAFLNQSQAQTGFVYGDIEFVKFYGQVKSTAGVSVPFIDADQAHLVPILADPSAYQTFYGPAPYMETVNTMAIPYYATIMEQNPKGMKVEACSIQLSLPRYPRSIVTLTK